MVVEDNDFVRMQLIKFLAEDGYSVIEARSGEQALQLFGQHITALVADVRMEPISGFELIRRLRVEGDKTPIVLVTGDQDPEMLSEATRLGVAGVLMKPVQKVRLLEMVHRAILTAQRTKK
jgi:CheY-like chemotaxis protein